MAAVIKHVTWRDWPSVMRLVRTAKGLSQEQLANAIGCTRIHVWRLERGKRRPSRAFLHALIHTCTPERHEVQWIMAFEQLVEYRCEELDVTLNL